MKYVEIREEDKVFPGEYLLHEPTNRIVLCGSVIYEERIIRGLCDDGMVTDAFENYRKISASRKEVAETFKTKCKGCGG